MTCKIRIARKVLLLTIGRSKQDKVKSSRKLSSLLHLACPCGQVSQPQNKSVGQALSFLNCCSQYIERGLKPLDAYSLMRSRYTAFALEIAPYLLTTWHPKHRPQEIQFERGIKWVGLEILDCCDTGPTSSDVEFIARYKVGGKAQKIHERSHFVFEESRWYYTDGELFD